jgi:hypothetical protein
MADEYLPVREAARRIGMQPKSLRKRMYDGTFRRGVEWFHPVALGVRFKWSAVVARLEADRTVSSGAAFGPDIPSAR